MEMYALISLAVFYVICATFSYFLARDKGRDGAAWVILALFFGPLALIAAAGLPDERLRARLGMQRTISDTAAAEETISDTAAGEEAKASEMWTKPQQ